MPETETTEKRTINRVTEEDFENYLKQALPKTALELTKYQRGLMKYMDRLESRAEYAVTKAKALTTQLESYAARNVEVAAALTALSK